MTSFPVVLEYADANAHADIINAFVRGRLVLSRELTAAVGEFAAELSEQTSNAYKAEWYRSCAARFREISLKEQ